MAITRIHHPPSNTDGWQARWPNPNGGRFTKFYAIATHGGLGRAYDLAAKAERQMRRRAKALRKGK